ncbi:hypothetical protein BP5796_04037 [Coleophoma crateriformis]|uniref:Uncharacterized protein n=1 Tax=Coleophoma crateriformis TaxID=565419 RepID=A0A3D8SHG8_9HELO|nr:hypothetical protein BP5796_04037 [Coleophoma crateriformis]
MSGKPPSVLQKVWFQWKSIKLPWRNRVLVGLDLSGNTYWEFRDSNTALRMRRIVEYPRHVPYSEVKISPQWHQWLRHTREQPPSLTEQSQDLVRQRNLKILAAEADRRWREKPSFLDRPGAQRSGLLDRFDPASAVHAPVSAPVLNAAMGPQQSSSSPPVQRTEEKKEKNVEDDPWKKARGGPSEDWQPQAWDPNHTVAARR